MKVILNPFFISFSRPERPSDQFIVLGNRVSYLLVIMFLSFIGFAQQVNINGKANSYKGEVMDLYTYDDYITLTPRLLSSTIVDEYGNFTLSVSLNKITYAYLKCSKQWASIYIQPQANYNVNFPARDTVRMINPNVEQQVNLSFDLKDTNDINALIMNYNKQFDLFWEKNYQYFVVKNSRHKLDTFRVDMQDRYSRINNDYFKTYYSYAIALLDESTFHNRSKITKTYILNKAVSHDNKEYMTFFNEYFKQYLQKLTAAEFGDAIVERIGKSDLQGLNEVLKQDKLLATSDTLRELVMLKGLMELYYVPQFKKEKIVSLLEQVQSKSIIEPHRIIAANIVKSFVRLQNGSEAPGFVLRDKNAKIVSLDDFKGKYVYLDFWATWCTPCLQEMKMIPQLQKKYGDKIVFISISIDKNASDMLKFISNNPKYDWTFLHYGGNEKIKDDYMIKTVPMYFLIDPKGKFVQSPALRPSEGIEPYFDQITNSKKPKFKVGDKTN